MRSGESDRKRASNGRIAALQGAVRQFPMLWHDRKMGSFGASWVTKVSPRRAGNSHRVAEKITRSPSGLSIASYRSNYGREGSIAVAVSPRSLHRSEPVCVSLAWRLLWPRRQD